MLPPVFTLAAMQTSNVWPVSGGRVREWAPGLLLVGALAAAAALLASWPGLSRWGASALTLAIVLGMLFGNTALPRWHAPTAAGIDFARSTLLRLGIVLFGWRISLADVAAVGVPGVLLAVIVVGGTFALALWIGVRWLRMDRATVVLIGAGSAICGAAAVMGAQSVVRAPERSAAVAVATVVVFGTLSMLLYPLLYAWSGLTPWQFGLFAGGTIHEVAQVVAVGAALGVDDAANAAVIEKMLRVVLLAPFLLLLALGYRASDGGAARPRWRADQMPWFAVGFLLVVALHSTGWVPAAVVALLVDLASLLLAMGMVAIGLRTRFSSLREAGLQPLKLAALLFLFLTGGGYLLTRLLTAWG